jgi:hypothetical protein
LACENNNKSYSFMVLQLNPPPIIETKTIDEVSSMDKNEQK